MKKFRNILMFILVMIVCSLFLISGCAKKESETIKIGAILPLTGEIAPFGESAQRGINIAAEEINSLSPTKVKILFEDDKSTAKDAVSAMNKLVEVDNVKVALGGIASSIALATAPIANERHVVLMCVFASSPKITDAGDYVFRTMPSDAYQGVISAEWMKSLKYNKVAIVYTKNDWGEALKDVFNKEFKNRGGEVIFEEGISSEGKDFRSVLSKISPLKPDVLFMATYPREGAILTKQAKELKIKSQIIGGDPWANRDYLDGAKEYSEGVMFTAPLQYQGKEFQAFAKKFKEKYGIEPDLTASAGYDSLKIIYFAIESIKKKNEEPTGERIKEQLYQIRDFKGVTGVTTFDSNGDVIGKDFSKKIITKGKVEDWK